MRVKALLLIFLFMGSCLFAQPAQPLNLFQIKQVMTYSTDINELVEKVKSLEQGFEVTGEISEKGTKFSNGRFQFTLSAYRGHQVIYEETIKNSGIGRRPDLLTEVKLTASRKIREADHQKFR